MTKEQYQNAIRLYERDGGMIFARTDWEGYDAFCEFQGAVKMKAREAGVSYSESSRGSGFGREFIPHFAGEATVTHEGFTFHCVGEGSTLTLTLLD